MLHLTTPPVQVLGAKCRALGSHARRATCPIELSQDVGVGTGFYLTHVPESSLISLMDLNEASLNAASTRAGESKIKHKINENLFDPIALGKWDI